MTITKNSLIVISLSLLVILVIYFYGSSSVDYIIDQKYSLVDWNVMKNFGWLPASFTFGLGVLVGWLLFKKKS